MPRLPRLSITNEYGTSESGSPGSSCRERFWSPSGASTFTTSAPKSAITAPAAGTRIIDVTSTTRMPSSTRRSIPDALHSTAMTYYPAPDDWNVQTPAQAGMRPATLEAAAAYHRAREYRVRRAFPTCSGRYAGVADEPPSPAAVLGPVRPRTGANGVILRGGYMVAEWGDTARADMTFSVAKSYLAVLAGLAV